jgi:hypothetical protein
VGELGKRLHHGAAALAPAVTVSVVLPDPVTVPGIEQVVSVSVLATVQVNVTAPVKLFTGLTVIVEVPELLGVSVRVLGETLSAKSSAHS